jgi:hypothetical protein
VGVCDREYSRRQVVSFFTTFHVKVALQEKSNLLKSKVFKQVSSSQGNQVPNAVQKTLPIVIPANAGIQ